MTKLVVIRDHNVYSGDQRLRKQRNALKMLVGVGQFCRSSNRLQITDSSPIFPTMISLYTGCVTKYVHLKNCLFMLITYLRNNFV